MPQSRTKRERVERVNPFRDPADRHWSHWLTRAALVLAATVVFARVTTSQVMRNPFDVFASTAPAVRGTGPAEGIWLDLLACVPALLVLLRRAVDREFTLRAARSAVPMVALSGWAVASTLWADDKFVALLSSCHLLAAAALLWALAQVVRSWLRLRIVAAVCFGLLLVMIGHAVYYRYIEVPALERFLAEANEDERPDAMQNADSFTAKQFQSRVGQMYGFTKSSNSFAAVVVLLSVVSGGALAQRMARRSELLPDLKLGGALPAIGLAAALAGSATVLTWTQSRTGWATAAVAAVLLATIAWRRQLIARHAQAFYFAGVAAFAVCACVVVAIGLTTGGLGHVSMTFRWRYWVGAADAFLAHPILGVGYENFGPHYLIHRLPVAAEEVTDPHNFVVRVVTELGLIGGALLLAWQLRLWWDLTRPTAPADPAAPPAAGSRVSAIAVALLVGAAGMFVSVIASLDFSQSLDYLGLELLQRGALLGLFVLGATIVLVRAVEAADADDRPAPWLLYGSLVAAGMFLLHNLVDFSLFEPGPMLLFAMVTGAALGVRTTEAAATSTGRLASTVGLAIGVAVWMAAATTIAVPVTFAESGAAQGDDAVRAKEFRDAVTSYRRAAEQVPYNADYWFRAAQATAYSGGDPTELLDRALATRSLWIRPLLFRAGWRLQSPQPEWPLVLADYRRAVGLNPNDVGLRRDFAEVLARSGDRGEAQAQLTESLRLDALLAPDEQKRLTEDQKAAVRAEIDKMGKP